MEQQIKDRFHNAILQEVMRRYGISDSQIQILDGFESFIYEFERESGGGILRIGHSLHRNEALIHGEVDWINYLARGGVSVARAILSHNEKLVETVEDGQGGQFLATAFIKARGRSPWRSGWTPSLYETYGQLMGSMHALAQNYQPPEPSWKRPEWDEDWNEFVGRYLPASESIAWEKYQNLLMYLAELPKDTTSYGLIHQDAHGGNFFVDEAGCITMFDFDDCVYSWFINDIAIVLFYLAQGQEDPASFNTREFMTHFLEGYQSVRWIDPKWLKEIPYFLKLREIELYAVMHRDFDVNHIEDPWCASFMRDRKYKIEHDVPFIDFDFNSLSPVLTQQSK